MIEFKRMHGPGCADYVRASILLSLNASDERVRLTYTKEDPSCENESRWELQAQNVAALKTTSEEFTIIGYLSELPSEGACFELVKSPWIEQLKSLNEEKLVGLTHFIFCFYDETVEFVAKELSIRPMNEVSLSE